MVPAGRHHQHIHIRPCVVTAASQFAQAIKRLKSVNRTPLFRGLKHLACHGIYFVRMRSKKFLDGGIALGHPRAVVEQTMRALGKRKSISTMSASMPRSMASDCSNATRATSSPKNSRCALAGTPQRNAEPNAGKSRMAYDISARINIPGIVATHHIQYARCVLASQRKHRHAIERSDKRAPHHACSPRPASA